MRPRDVRPVLMPHLPRSKKKQALVASGSALIDPELVFLPRFDRTRTTNKVVDRSPTVPM